jgi:hypothetical protein
VIRLATSFETARAWAACRGWTHVVSAGLSQPSREIDGFAGVGYDMDPKAARELVLVAKVTGTW